MSIVLACSLAVVALSKVAFKSHCVTVKVMTIILVKHGVQIAVVKLN